jgi:hypothetical protein
MGFGGCAGVPLRVGGALGGGFLRVVGILLLGGFVLVVDCTRAVFCFRIFVVVCRGGSDGGAWGK